MCETCLVWAMPSVDVCDMTHSSVCDISTLQHTATHCNKLQHTATHCSTLQYTTTHCNTLQHTATHCNTLQHTATHCNTLQLTATHCNTLQHTATQRHILQHTQVRTVPLGKNQRKKTLQSHRHTCQDLHTRTHTHTRQEKHKCSSNPPLASQHHTCNTLQHTATRTTCLQPSLTSLCLC